VHQAQPQRTHVGPQPHRQRRQRGALAGIGGCAQPRQDAVGALDHAVAHPVGVGAAAAGLGIVVRRGQFGLDIAAQGLVRQHTPLHTREDGGVGVEPVEVAVEHQPLAAAFALEAFEHARQRQFVAIQPTHDIQHLERLQALGRLHREVLGPIAVMQRAAAPGCPGLGRGRLLRDGHGATVAAAMAASALPTVSAGGQSRLPCRCISQRGSL
jgi:hypothetical protein